MGLGGENGGERSREIGVCYACTDGPVSYRSKMQDGKIDWAKLITDPSYSVQCNPDEISLKKGAMDRGARYADQRRLCPI